MKARLWICLPLGFALLGFAAGHFSSRAPAPPTAVSVATAAAPTTPHVTLPVPPSSTPAITESLDVLLEYPSALHRRVALARQLRSPAAPPFSQVLVRLLAAPEPEPTLLDVLFTVWAERAPEAAVEAVATLPPRLVNGVRYSILRTWAPRDRKGAQAWAEANLPAFELKSWNASQAPSKPAPTLPEILRLGDEKERSTSLYQHFMKRVRNEPVAAMHDAVTQVAREDRRKLIPELLYAWERSDPAAVLRWSLTAEGREVDELSNERGALFEAFEHQLAVDPGSARATVEQWPDSSRRDDGMRNVAVAMLANDPAGAVAYFEAHLARRPDTRVTPFFQALLRVDPDGAAAALRERVNQQLAEKNASYAQNEAISALTETITRDPARAGNFIATLPPSVQGECFYALGETWCGADGAAALAWAAAQPAGSSRDQALKQFTFLWARHDAKQTTAMLDRLPADSGRWAATEGFVFSVIDTDPDAALQWARTIQEERKRYDVMHRAWGRWSNINGASAADWRQQVTLTPAEITALDRDE
ncbi:MAG: hypothetical protein QOE70_2166 [Chthoniobacter sp.]|jgi:hypothetical protein|nr:hypothetical protein [Chthoniobacter sp.]